MLSRHFSFVSYDTATSAMPPPGPMTDLFDDDDLWRVFGGGCLHLLPACSADTLFTAAGRVEPPDDALTSVRAPAASPAAPCRGHSAFAWSCRA